MNKISFVFVLLIAWLILITVAPRTAKAQLQRERALPDAPVGNLFWAPTNIGISTVQNPDAANLNSTVAHIFGIVSGGVDHFFGLDDGANTRIGLDYGINDRLSMGVGRMTFNKVVDIRGKFNILRQTTSGSTPVDLGVKTSIGISTLSGVGLEFSDRLSYLTSVMIARKFNGFSLQLSPMIAHFNTVSATAENQLFGVGFLVNYEITDRFALSAEYLPVIGERNPGTTDEMAIALNIDTGGHIFQLFLSTSQWHNEQYIMANNRDRFWEGDIRFGFNINRVFGLGGR